MRDIVIVSIFIVLGGITAMEIGIITAIAELIAGMIARVILDYNLISFQTPDIINVLADIGMLTLMYVAGLEIDLDMLSKKLKKSVIMGFSSFIFPFTAIFLFAIYMVPSFIPLSIEEALLSAIIISSTSISIIYPILIKRSHGQLGEEEKLVLCMAMVGELITICAWSIFFLEVSLQLIAFIIFLSIFTIMFPYFGKKIFSRFKGNASEFEFKVILLLLLVIAVMSEEAGAEAAIIAFLMGMVTSEVIIEHKNLLVKLRGIVFGFFAPIFFFKVGLDIDFIHIVSEFIKVFSP